MTRRRGGEHGPRPSKSHSELQRCSWRFWDEPDNTNYGPQIIVTEPNGEEHYLIDLETFWLKLRKRSERHAAENARDPEKAMLFDENMKDMLNCTVQETSTCGKDDKEYLSISDTPSMTAAATKGQRLSTRLKQAFSRRSGQPRNLLPLCHNGGEDGSSQPEDSGTGRLLGFGSTQDSCRRRQGVEMDMLRLIGVLGLLRTIAYCCSKS